MNDALLKFTATETSPAVAFQLGRADALTGRPATRFDGTPYTGNLPIPPGTISLTDTEAAAIAEIREEYLAGYRFAEVEDADIVAVARARTRKFRMTFVA